MRVQDNTKVNVDVQIEFLNQEICPGLKQGGVLNIVRRSIELSCNANKIPEKLQYDLVTNDIGDSIKISNIDLPGDVKPTITDRDFVIATLAAPTVEVEEEVKPDEDAEETGEEVTTESDGIEEEKSDDKEKKEQKNEESAEDKSK